MSSPLELGKEAVRHERAINSLRDRTGAPLMDVRRLFAQEFLRLELGAKVRSYLSVLTTSNARALLRRNPRIVPGGIAMHDHTASLKSGRLAEELERLWNEHLRSHYLRVARTVSARGHEATRFRERFPRIQLRSTTRMLKEQLSAEGVSVWVSAGCLAELARMATAAAARTRQTGEAYELCLRREIVTHARFIREWTSSDKKFDQTQCSEFVSIARKYALPRSWRLCESVASVRLSSVTAQTPAPGAVLAPGGATQLRVYVTHHLN